jgi:putative glutamine amidotransferase
MKRKVLYSAIWREGYPFSSLVETVQAANRPSDLVETDSFLVVWGGADISPALYNHPESRTTYSGGNRDGIEWALMKAAVKKGIPIIGVCRGAQMLCALAGGYLLQDVDNHSGSHQVNTINGDTLTVNSIHHQMMAGYEKVGHELLAWSETNRSPSYIWQDDKKWTPPDGWKEPEFIYFTDVKGFAVQWHPEMMRENSPATEFIMSVIKDKVSSYEHATESV